MPDPRTKNNLHLASHKIFTSLAELMTQLGMSYEELERHAKAGFIQNELNDQANPAREAKRIAEKTGLAEDDVADIIKTVCARVAPEEDDMTAPSDVLAIWFTEPAFLTQGQPKPLPYEDENNICFLNLVDKVKTNVPAIITLKALIESGAVAEQPDGLLQAVRRVYVPKSSQAELIHRMGRSLVRIIKTLTHNTTTPAERPRFLETSTTSRWFPRRHIDELQALARSKALRTLKEIDDYIQEKEERNGNEDDLCEVGVGLYNYCLDHDMNNIAPNSVPSEKKDAE